MQKLFIVLLFIFFSVNVGYACEEEFLGKEIPKEFKESCYEFSGKINIQIDSTYIQNDLSCDGWNTYKINSDKKIDTFISGNKIIPYKLFKNSGDIINYKINILGDINYLKDNNYKTYLVLDTSEKKEIIVELEKTIKANTFNFDFKYLTDNFYVKYSISKNGEKYFFISKENIIDYDFKYLKIFFESKTKEIKNEKIKITELIFKNKNFQYLIQTKGNIKAFSNNLCKNKYINITNNNGNFTNSIETKTLDLKMYKNNSFDIFKKEDSDLDGINDDVDNCKNIYNPSQKDLDGNGIGDMCSDNDKDGFIGVKDNCIYTYNPDQKDINRNGVGDKCEFDKDKDNIFDEQDNCINIYNPDQKDKDKDGVGDVCDNSIYFNPKQIDKNNNGIGDITEKKEAELLKNDKDKDGVIDHKDNCKEIANPNQEDFDKDGIGDACDNCKNIQNTNQLDFNKNLVGDICEDSDLDGIEGLVDNCINIYNPDQKDSDNNGIGDICEDKDNDRILFIHDNCPYDFNPEQRDVDKDNIGDKCDLEDNRYIESNSAFFIGLLVFIGLIFAGGIFFMIRKLK